MPEAAKEKAKEYVASYTAWEAAMGCATVLEETWQELGKGLLHEGIVPEEDFPMRMYDAANEVIRGSLQ